MLSQCDSVWTNLGSNGVFNTNDSDADQLRHDCILFVPLWFRLNNHLTWLCDTRTWETGAINVTSLC